MFSIVPFVSSSSSHQPEDESRADSGLQDARHRACPCYQWWLFACLSLWETERNFSPLHTSLMYIVAFLTIVRTCNQLQKGLTGVWQRVDLSHFLPVWSYLCGDVWNRSGISNGYQQGMLRLAKQADQPAIFHLLPVPAHSHANLDVGLMILTEAVRKQCEHWRCRIMKVKSTWVW